MPAVSAAQRATQIHGDGGGHDVHRGGEDFMSDTIMVSRDITRSIEKLCDDKDYHGNYCFILTRF